MMCHEGVRRRTVYWVHCKLRITYNLRYPSNMDTTTDLGRAGAVTAKRILWVFLEPRISKWTFELNHINHNIRLQQDEEN
jgi:hypothetical protein